MNCNGIRTVIGQQGLHRDRLTDDQRQHLASCELCRTWYEGALLQAALEGQVVPQPSPDFVERALTAAAMAGHRQHRGGRIGSLAAVAVLVVATTIGLLLAVPGGDGVNDPATAVRLVNVLIDAKDARRGATVTVELSEQLELQGFVGRRVIEWQADLVKGKNLLALPVITKTGGTGEMRVALSRDGAVRNEMRIQVDAG